MRSLFAIIAALWAATVSASPNFGPLTSDASGTYLASDRVCRVVLSQYQRAWVQIDVRCLGFDGGTSYSLTTFYTSGGCPQGPVLSLTPYAPNEYISIRWFNPVDQTMGIVRGTDVNAVLNGIGTFEAWDRIGRSPPAFPYTCGPARFRVFGP